MRATHYSRTTTKPRWNHEIVRIKQATHYSRIITKPGWNESFAKKIISLWNSTKTMLYTIRRSFKSFTLEARYTLFLNKDKKRTNRRNLCEMWIVCREWFVRFVSISRKTFLRNAFAGIGGFLTNSKNFFRYTFRFYTYSRKLRSMTNSM